MLTPLFLLPLPLQVEAGLEVREGRAAAAAAPPSESATLAAVLELGYATRYEKRIHDANFACSAFEVQYSLKTIKVNKVLSWAVDSITPEARSAGQVVGKALRIVTLEAKRLCGDQVLAGKLSKELEKAKVFDIKARMASFMMD